MNPLFIIFGTVVIGVVAVGLALYSLEEERRREKPYSGRRRPSPKSPNRPSKPRNPLPTLEKNYSGCCFHASACTNCENKEAVLVEFLPCGGTYFCNRCAMQYLERNEYCSLCPKRIRSFQ